MDDSLAKRLARGDKAAFADLYDACAARLHDYLVRRLGSREDAADVTQETFVRLARSRRRLAKAENLVAYVFVVARNEAARLTARRSREARAARGAAESTDQHSPPSDANDTVAAALAQLSVEQREIVELKTYYSFTFREIALITDLPQGTVATRYRSAIERLRGWLAKELR